MQLNNVYTGKHTPTHTRRHTNVKDTMYNSQNLKATQTSIKDRVDE